MKLIVFVLLLAALVGAYQYSSEPKIPQSNPVVKSIAVEEAVPPNVYTLPVPPPEEGNEPLSEEDVVYRNKLNDNAVVLKEAIINVITLLNDPDMYSQQWQNEFTYTVGQISAAVNEAKQIRPPARYIGTHRQYVNICDSYNTAMYNIMQGLSDRNADKIMDGVKLINETNVNLENMTVQG